MTFAIIVKQCLLEFSGEKENWKVNLYFCPKTPSCMYVKVFSFFRKALVPFHVISSDHKL
uniref:Uncharacterized protein n=1 Tax=Ursus maritimus TaxID=29073 RepID=A0A452V8Y9_URSMA